jgi:magnesium transporter
MMETSTLTERLTPQELREAWPVLNREERLEGFQNLARSDAEEFFLELTPRAQAMVVLDVPRGERRLWMRLLAPDDAADVLQEVEPERRGELLGLLDAQTRAEVTGLLAYNEDDAGGLMSPRFARLRPDMTIDEAIVYLRRQARERLETIYYVYVLDSGQRLLGVVSFRELFAVPGSHVVRDVMAEGVVTVRDDMDQEAVAHVIAQHDLLAVPVVDEDNRVKGIVTVDDIVDVVQEEATEDIQKLGGMEALDIPYLQTGFWSMVRKRAGWLSALFLGEMLTTSAMGHFQHELEQAIVLSIFIPLIVSSGGNSGSQASTLVIRAMSLGEVKLRDWWRIVRRESASGLALGSILACIALVRILGWQAIWHSYGEHAVLVAVTVALSVLGVVLWGTLSGSMLPFAIRRLGFDPASASAPFVATLVDVVGIVIYFAAAQLVLRGTLL